MCSRSLEVSTGNLGGPDQLRCILYSRLDRYVVSIKTRSTYYGAPMQTCRLTHEQSGRTIVERIVCANTTLLRLVGLLGKTELPVGEGIWLQPSSGVHTFGMGFPIDVLGLNEQLQVVRLWPNLRPRRITPLDFRVKSVLELAQGVIKANGIRLYDQLNLLPNPDDCGQTMVRNRTVPGEWT